MIPKPQKEKTDLEIKDQYGHLDFYFMD